jgi:hypothetical protein
MATAPLTAWAGLLTVVPGTEQYIAVVDPDFNPSPNTDPVTVPDNTDISITGDDTYSPGPGTFTTESSISLTVLLAPDGFTSEANVSAAINAAGYVHSVGQVASYVSWLCNFSLSAPAQASITVVGGVDPCLFGEFAAEAGAAFGGAWYELPYHFPTRYNSSDYPTDTEGSEVLSGILLPGDYGVEDYCGVTYQESPGGEYDGTDAWASVSVQLSPVPEPGTLSLLIMALLGLAGASCLRRRGAKA